MSRRQYLIIGAGRFGSAMAETLANADQEVVVVDSSEAAIDAIVDKVDHAMILDATNENALLKLGIDTFDVVVVAIGHNFEASILATVAAKAAGARHLISKANTQMVARVLASVGADEVVRPEHDMGIRLASQLLAPSVVHAFDLGTDHTVAEVETHELEGSLSKLRLPDKFGIHVIAVHRGETLTVNPSASFEIAKGDRLLVVGSHADFARFHEEPLP